MALDEALAYARAHQPALRAARARVVAAAADTKIARAQWLPGVGITAQAFEGTTNNTTASYLGAPRVDLPRIGGTRVTATGDFGPSASTLAAIGAQQEVFDFGRIAAQAAVSDVAYKGERFRADGERLRIDLLVREAYYGVHGARAVLRAAEDAYQRSRSHRDLAAAEVKSGLHAPIELTRAEADLTRFNVGRIRAAGSLRTAQAVFAAAAGVEDHLLDAAGQPPPMAAVPALEPGLRQAVDRDPLLQEARTRVRGAETLTHAIAAEMRPDLLLTATLSGRAGTAAPSSGSVSDTYGPLPIVPNWDLGLVLRWPLYDPVVAARRDAAASRTEVARELSREI
jgi:outer membrane protein